MIKKKLIDKGKLTAFSLQLIIEQSQDTNH